jgi:hypothetical protein
MTRCSVESRKYFLSLLQYNYVVVIPLIRSPGRTDRWGHPSPPSMRLRHPRSSSSLSAPPPLSHCYQVESKNARTLLVVEAQRDGVKLGQVVLTSLRLLIALTLICPLSSSPMPSTT